MSNFFKSIHGIGGFKSNAGKFSNPFSKTMILNIPYVDPQGSDFKFFVPPGTVALNATFNSSNAALVGTATRADIMPFKYDIKAENFNKVEWEGDNGASIERLRQSDYLAKNFGGHGTIAYFRTQTPLEKGSWIYSRLIEATDRISNVHVTITVYKKVFNEWFNSVKWGLNGDPILNETATQSKPGPAPINPVPAPTPPIIPTNNGSKEIIVVKLIIDSKTEFKIKELIDYLKGN